MKWIIGILFITAAGLGGAWYRTDRRNAELLQIRLDAPFQEYAERYGQNLKYGQIAPDFSLDDASGRTLRFSDICRHSKLTIVTTIGDADDTSIRRLVDLREAYRSLHGKGLSVVALSDLPTHEIRAVAHQYAVPFPILADRDRKIARSLGATLDPYSIMVDPNRRTVFVSSGLRSEFGLDEITDKAQEDLTGHRPFSIGLPYEDIEFRNTTIPEFYLNQLDGEPFLVSKSTNAAFIVISQNCPTCEDVYRSAMTIDRDFDPSTPSYVVLVGPIPVDREWARSKASYAPPGVHFVADIADIARTEFGLPSYGGGVRIRNGRITDRIQYSPTTDYERALTHILTDRR